MANPEFITVLTARSSLLDRSARSSVVGVRLTRTEYAGYLAGCSRLATLLALAKHLGDDDSIRELVAAFRVRVVQWAIDEQWTIRRGQPVLCNLSAIAVFEQVSPNVHAVCNGRGRIGERVCRGCGGTGRKPLSGRRIAELCGLELKDWQRHWRGRYVRMLDCLAEAEAEVESAVERKFKKVDSDSKTVYKTPN